MKQVTEWYPGDIDPVRDGWYEVRGDFVEGRRAMRLWKNKGWWWNNPSEGISSAAVSIDDEWRGLREKP